MMLEGRVKQLEAELEERKIMDAMNSETAGYEYNERHSQPASDIPGVAPIGEIGRRHGNTGDVFVISGE